jgi:hypothetical protein
MSPTQESRGLPILMLRIMLPTCIYPLLASKARWCARLGTLVPVMLGRVVRDPASVQSGLVRPLGGVLHLPRPVDPALTVVLPGLGLGIKVVPEEGLVFAVKSHPNENMIRLGSSMTG